MLGDLEQLYKNREISEEAYRELKSKYEREMEKIDDYDFMDLGDIIREKIENSLKKAFSITNFYMGEEFVKKEEIKGKFGAGNVDIDFAVENGKMTLKKSEEDEYRITIIKRVKARDEEDAEDKFRDVDIEIERGDDRLMIYASDTVDIVAELPEKNYRVKSESENGVIIISDLKGEEASIETENGTITLKNLRFSEIDGKTENGRINIENVKGKKIRVFTENGSIILLDTKADEIIAESENGRISSECDADRQRLKTEHGSILTTVLRGKSIISTEMGSIKIRIPEETKAIIEARIDRGTIRYSGRIITSEEGYKKIIVNEDGIEEAKIRVDVDFGSLIIL